MNKNAKAKSANPGKNEQLGSRKQTAKQTHGDAFNQTSAKNVQAAKSATGPTPQPIGAPYV